MLIIGEFHTEYSKFSHFTVYWHFKRKYDPINCVLASSKKSTSLNMHLGCAANYRILHTRRHLTGCKYHKRNNGTESEAEEGGDGEDATKAVLVMLEIMPGEEKDVLHANIYQLHVLTLLLRV